MPEPHDQRFPSRRQQNELGPVPDATWERFWSRVQKTDSCWLWTGLVNTSGYGQFRSPFIRTRLTHRIAYMLLVGPIPDGLDLDHLCRVPACLNPSHLEAVPHRVNLRRGETVNREALTATHCRNGHEYTPETTRWRTWPWGRDRECRVCARERIERFYAKRGGQAAYHRELRRRKKVAQNG